MINLKDNNRADIVLVEHIGNLTGAQSYELQNYLNKCLDSKSCFQLIDLRRTAHIDSLGCKVLSDFVVRGGKLRLFNVGPELKWILQIEDNKDVIKFYDESNAAVAFSLFEKDILKDKHETISKLKTRRHVRIGTNLPAEFKAHPDNNEAVYGRADVVNLSEGGMLIKQIDRMIDSKDQIINPYALQGKKFSDIKFRLEKTDNYFMTDGHCVRVTNGSSSVFSGIRFEGLKKKNKNAIADFVHRNLSNGVTLRGLAKITFTSCLFSLVLFFAV